MLFYATSGGTGTDQTGDSDHSTYGPSGTDITDLNLFAGIFKQLVSALSASGGKGIVINIPSISSIPFFSTVPYNTQTLDQATVDFPNSEFIPNNTGLEAAASANTITEEERSHRTIFFTTRLNAVIRDLVTKSLKQ